MPKPTGSNPLQIKPNQSIIINLELSLHAGSLPVDIDDLTITIHNNDPLKKKKEIPITIATANLPEATETEFLSVLGQVAGIGDFEGLRVRAEIYDSSDDDTPQFTTQVPVGVDGNYQLFLFDSENQLVVRENNDLIVSLLNANSKIINEKTITINQEIIRLAQVSVPLPYVERMSKKIAVEGIGEIEIDLPRLNTKFRPTIEIATEVQLMEALPAELDPSELTGIETILKIEIKGVDTSRDTGVFANSPLTIGLPFNPEKTDPVDTIALVSDEIIEMLETETVSTELLLKADVYHLSYLVTLRNQMPMVTEQIDNIEVKPRDATQFFDLKKYFSCIVFSPRKYWSNTHNEQCRNK